MNDLFPATQREHYRKAPLFSVICQLRFPKLLAIESGVPVDFQERVRSVFPLLQREQLLPADLPPELLQMLGQQSGRGGYQFMTEDKSYVISLGSDSLSVATSAYTRWEKFREHLELAHSALVEVYRPSFFNRVGLRYQDAIQRSLLGLSDVPWSELIKRELLGELSLPNFEAQLEGVADRALRLRNPDRTGSILLRHGIGQVAGTTETAYVIDWDFFAEQKTEVANAIDVVTHYNKLAGNAFRWCITEKLRKALDPVLLDG
jgi:uncharacterized protein (TIGR04255 family)